MVVVILDRGIVLADPKTEGHEIGSQIEIPFHLLVKSDTHLLPNVTNLTIKQRDASNITDIFY